MWGRFSYFLLSFLVLDVATLSQSAAAFSLHQRHTLDRISGCVNSSLLHRIGRTRSPFESKPVTVDDRLKPRPRSDRRRTLKNALILFVSTLALGSVRATASSASLHQVSPRTGSNIELVFRILWASLLGTILGSERSTNPKQLQITIGAGRRTMALVSLGACVFTITGIQGFALTVARETAKVGTAAAMPGIENASVDASRMASTITAGVGFLGAGVISNNRMPDGTFDKESTKYGIITAATIWVSAAIGAAAGAGMYYASLCFLLSSLLVNRLGEWSDNAKPVKGSEKKSLKAQKENTLEATNRKVPQIQTGSSRDAGESSVGVSLPRQEEPSVEIAPLLEDKDGGCIGSASDNTTSLHSAPLTGVDLSETLADANADANADADADANASVNANASADYADADTDTDATLQSGKPVDDKESPPFASPKNVDLYVEKFLKKEGAKKLGKDEFSSEDGVANDL